MQRLEEEYRAKLAELESKMSTAQMQVNSKPAMYQSVRLKNNPLSVQHIPQYVESCCGLAEEFKPDDNSRREVAFSIKK